MILVTSTIVSLQQKQRAERRFQEVRELARFVLFEFDDAIRSGVTPARKKLVARALGYLDGLARETEQDVSLRREVMEGYFKVGDVQGNLYGPNLGDSSGARQSYLQALQLAESLHSANPQDPVSRRDLARARVKLGDLTALGGNRAEALQEYQKALQVFDELAASNPKDPDARRNVLAVANKVGFTHYQLGNLNAALASYRRCLEIARELYRADPSVASARRAMAVGHERIGEVLARSGNTAEGLDNLRAALTIYRELASAHPADALARAFEATGKLEQAIQTDEKALALLPAGPSELRKEFEANLARFKEKLGRPPPSSSQLAGSGIVRAMAPKSVKSADPGVPTAPPYSSIRCSTPRLLVGGNQMV